MKKLLRELQSKHKKGFTLLEVLVVVIILIVLAAIAVPTYQKVIRKSRVSDGLNALDMFAGAQDKYFIQNGMYAQNLKDLKAPLKDYISTSPDNIETTNFTYSKSQGRNCIEAHANIGGNYTLVKNYQSKEKVVCINGEDSDDCSDISDYVNTYTGDYSDFCPEVLNPNGICTLTDASCDTGNHNSHLVDPELPSCHCECINSLNCGENKIFNNNFLICACECKQEKIDACNEEGMTIDPETCECIDNGGGNPVDDCDCSEIPEPTGTSYVPDTSNCKKYGYKCEKTSNGQCAWVIDEDNISWVQPDYNCITGMAPILCTDNGQKGGNGGGRGQVDPSQLCGWAGQCDCLANCKNAQQSMSTPQYEFCVSTCGGFCPYCSGGGNGSGPGFYGNCAQPQSCSPGWYFNMFVCYCVLIPENGGGGNGGGEGKFKFKYCDNCKLTDCTYCDPAERPDDYETQCAIYHTVCDPDWAPDESGWFPGSQYYSYVMTDPEGQPFESLEPNVVLKEGAVCENGQVKSCTVTLSDGTIVYGTKTCADCKWGDCTPGAITYAIEDVKGIVNSSDNSAYICIGGYDEEYVGDNPNIDCVTNPDTPIQVCSPQKHQACKDQNQQPISSCPNANYTQFCNNHPGGKCIIGSAGSCSKANCWLQCCSDFGFSNGGCTLNQNYADQDRNCAKTWKIVRCN